MVMEQLPHSPMDMSTTYRVCVLGAIDSDYAERYWGMKSSLIEQTGEPKRTTLVGEVTDQATLVGIINTLYNSGHTVVSVERLLPDADSHTNSTIEET